MEEIFQNKALNDKKLIFAFKGEVNEIFFKLVLNKIENKLENIEHRVKLKKKIFNILVEVLQNIYHYFQELKIDNPSHPVKISLYTDNNDYYISAGNPIHNDQVISLKLLLDKINALDKEQLVNLYREILITDNANRGRAGLGILDIKRKAGADIRYKFTLLNNQYSYFSLIVHVIA